MAKNKVILRDRSRGNIAFNLGARRQGANSTWFRGDHCNFNPHEADMMRSTSVRQHILSGWLPDAPYIGPETAVVAFGSCFASNITKWLEARQFNVVSRKDGDSANTFLVRFGEGLVTTFAIRGQFDWALNNKTAHAELWHDKEGKAQRADEETRLATRDLIMRGDVFIITLGLSEIWYDEPTGEAFWRAPPNEFYNPERHKFRVSTVSENKENLVELVKLIRSVRPHARIIFTLSPIPLVATFRPVSCITANAVSKAILRNAVDEVLREANDAKLHYWPSYEIVMTAFDRPWSPDRRHVIQEVLDFVMTQFEAAWCHGTAPRMTIAEAWLKACAAAGTCLKWVPRAVEAEDMEKVQKFFERSKDNESFAAAFDRIQEIAAANPSGPFAAWLENDPPPRIARLLNPERAGRLEARKRDQTKRAAALERKKIRAAASGPVGGETVTEASA